MEHLINTLIQKFGNLFSLTSVTCSYIRFKIGYREYYRSKVNGMLKEMVMVDDRQKVPRNTPHSEWIKALVEGKKRNADGNMI